MTTKHGLTPASEVLIELANHADQKNEGSAPFRGPSLLLAIWIEGDPYETVAAIATARQLSLSGTTSLAITLVFH